LALADFREYLPSRPQTVPTVQGSPRHMRNKDRSDKWLDKNTTLGTPPVALGPTYSHFYTPALVLGKQRFAQSRWSQRRSLMDCRSTNKTSVRAVRLLVAAGL